MQSIWKVLFGGHPDKTKRTLPQPTNDSSTSSENDKVGAEYKAWVKQTKIASPAEAWEKLQRLDWMLWLAESERVTLDPAKLRLFACDCAEEVLGFYEGQHPEDKRPRDAIETARRFARGEAGIEALRLVYALSVEAAQAAHAAAEVATRGYEAAAAADRAAEAACEAALRAAQAAVLARSADAGALMSKMREANAAVDAASANSQAALTKLVTATSADGAALAAMSAATYHKPMALAVLDVATAATGAAETKSKTDLSPGTRLSQSERFRTYFPNPLEGVRH